MARPSQRGGVALLVAFQLLVLMAAAALATSRNLVRDLAIRDALNRGEEAGWAAEDGLERCLASLGAPAEGEGLRRFLRTLEAASPGPAVPVPAGLLPKPVGPARCRIQVRHLGPLARPPARPEGPDESPGPGGSAPDRPDHLWQVRSAGIREAGTGPPFVQARERLLTVPAGVETVGHSGLRGRAWRVVPAD